MLRRSTAQAGLSVFRRASGWGFTSQLFGDVKNAGAALRNALAAFESLEKRLENEGAGRTSVKRIAEKLIASGAAPVGKQLKNLK